MLDLVGYPTLDALIDAAVPAEHPPARARCAFPPALSESEALAELRGIAARNQVFRSYLGTGYSDTLTPGVIQRNILENPGWYTAYTPYQAEIAQGRLEALLNFQTMVCDLTGLEIANASLLDEGTAAAEAMALAYAVRGRPGKREAFFVSERCHPQTIAVVQTRAQPLGIEVVVGDHEPARHRREILRRAGPVPGDGRHDFRLRGVRRKRPRRRRAGRRRGRPARACACSSRPASSARTWPSAARSVSACRWATAGRTRRTSR